ncbi:hypothetical protein Tco_1120461 [Tanacetum coccineum]
MVAFLEKSTGSDGFHQVIDFLNHSHISYALTKKPAVYVSFIKQFWRTAKVSTDTDGMVTITATIYGHSKTLTEASLRRHLKLEDHDGLTSLPNLEIFEQLALMGYHSESDKLTCQKGVFSPQWRFLIHTILHCLSLKKTDWEQFSSNIATALICLATDMQKKQLQQHSNTYPVPSLTTKVFNNMRRSTKGYTGVEVQLFLAMITIPQSATSPTPSSSPSRITSSPSPSSEPTPDHISPAEPSPSPIAPQHSQPSPAAEDHVSPPHESPFHAVHSHESDEGSLKLQELTNLVSQLSARIGVLETDLKKTKLIYSSAFTKLILRIPDKETEVHDKEVQEKASDETKLVVQDETPTKVLQDQESSEKGQSAVSTARATGTASEVPQMVSTAEERVSTAEVDISTVGRVVYSRRNSRVTRQDKGKGIMTEPESKNKSKKELEQERLSLTEAIRIQEKIDEDQRAQIARDEEIAKQWQEQERVESERVPTKEIDWNDPSVQKVGKGKRTNLTSCVEEVSKVSTGKRKKSFSRRKTKKQRVELDDEPEELKELLDIVPREDIAVETTYTLRGKEEDHRLGSTSGIRAFALRNFDLEVIEMENTQNHALAKLPMLKLGEYKMWEIRIKQYFQIQDYALWEVIENGNSWVPIPATTHPENSTSIFLQEYTKTRLSQLILHLSIFENSLR